MEENTIIIKTKNTTPDSNIKRIIKNMEENAITIENEKKEVRVTLNLKLIPYIRKRFSEIAHSKRQTMQSILSTFVESYIEDPDHFVIKTRMEVANGSRR